MIFRTHHRLKRIRPEGFSFGRRVESRVMGHIYQEGEGFASRKDKRTSCPCDSPPVCLPGTFVSVRQGSGSVEVASTSKIRQLIPVAVLWTPREASDAAWGNQRVPWSPSEEDVGVRAYLLQLLHSLAIAGHQAANLELQVLQVKVGGIIILASSKVVMLTSASGLAVGSGADRGRKRRVNPSSLPTGRLTARAGAPPTRTHVL